MWASLHTRLAVIRVCVSAIGAATILAACAGDAPDPTTPPPASAPAAVSVSLAATTLTAGDQTIATAVVRDAQNNVLPNYPVTWSSSNPLVATVDAAGAVTTVGEGSVSITATAGAKSESAALTVTSSGPRVTITGASWVKVGDTYQFGATVRSVDGSIIQRPITWSVADEALGSITAAGAFTPRVRADMTVRATIDGVTYGRSIFAYDWVGEFNGETARIRLPADVPVQDAAGQPVNPELILGCTGSQRYVIVNAGLSIVPNGSVSITVDGAPPVSQTWQTWRTSDWSDFNGVSSYGEPGSDNLFAEIISARHLAIAFADVNGVVRTAKFRVTGLEAALAAQMLGQSISSACLR